MKQFQEMNKDIQRPVMTLDNSVKISDWFAHYSLGNRVQKTSTGTVTKYIVDPNRLLPSVLAETDASGNITSYYVYGLGVISKIVGSNAYFYQYDGLGSTVAVTNTSGTVLNKYAYDDFGNLAMNSTETVANPFKYVGRFGVMTDATDLLYMRTRYYSPSMGRFINKDPIGLAGGLNSYTYVGNNPINHNDPTGEFINPVTAALVLLGTMIVWLTTWILQQLRDTGVESIEAPGPAEPPCEIPRPQPWRPPPGR